MHPRFLLVLLNPFYGNNIHIGKNYFHAKVTAIWTIGPLLGESTGYDKFLSLQKRHNERDGVPNHRPASRVLAQPSTICSGSDQRKYQKLDVTGLCEGNPPVTAGFRSQRASNAENVSIWRLHHVTSVSKFCSTTVSALPDFKLFSVLHCLDKCIRFDLKYPPGIGRTFGKSNTQLIELQQYLTKSLSSCFWTLYKT